MPRPPRRPEHPASVVKDFHGPGQPAAAAGWMKPLLRSAAGSGRYVSALVYFGPGAVAALDGQRQKA
ncbi:hypothetical protein J2X16_003827 [Pelomonas aquatica]|uniref:Uncharacterized protein n=1 Tax=Pelomonas aquatica TaxID=431058 RepID=A0ABU1ZCW2_9BURK|nr:hypothetical protein [Pelomonas aquatica]